MSRAVLLPAAGASSRMRGRDKLLEDVGGEPALRVMAERALASRAAVICTLPSADHPRAELLAGLDLRIVVVPDAEEGMAASLRRGAAAARGHDLMILPPDMPGIEAAHLREMWAGFAALPEGAILRAAAQDGTPGHPVIFPRAYLPNFAQLEGDRGAAAILRQHGSALRLHPLPGQVATRDLDTPEDWAAWRRASGPAE